MHEATRRVLSVLLRQVTHKIANITCPRDERLVITYYQSDESASMFLQIDGFEQDKKVVVIAATNRKQDLDPALIR